MNNAPIFEAQREAIAPLVEYQRWLLASLAACALMGTFVPVLLPQMAKPFKAALLLTGLLSSATAAALTYKTPVEEKLIKTIQDQQVKELGDRMAHQVAYNSAVRDMTAELELVSTIQTLPDAVQNLYLHKYGFAPLAQAPQVPQQQSNGVPDWVNGDIPNGVVDTVAWEETPLSENWIYDIVSSMAEPDPEKRRYQHLVVNGGSQSGKSTLFSKLLELFIKAIAAQGEKCQINLVDPKYPKTRWAIPPSFTGFDNVPKGIATASKELSRRKSECIKAVKSGQQQPNFPRYVLIVDEWDLVWGKGNGYGKEILKDQAVQCRDDVLRMMKEGAAYNVMVVVIGQSPLSEASGFSRSDTNSACRIVLGVEAVNWSQDPKFPFKEEAPFIQAAIRAYMRGNKRCALIVPNMSAPFVEGIPQLKITNLNINSVDRVDEDDEIIPEPIEEVSEYKALYMWIKELGRTPTNEEAQATWERLTGETLDETAIAYLIQNIERLASV